MDFVNVTSKVAADMVPVKKHLGYFISYKKYLRDVHMKMKHLNDARIDVEEHMRRNIAHRLEVPRQVVVWLEEVEKLNEKVENIPDDVGSSFNLMIRHKLGKKAIKIIEEIDSIITQASLICWTDAPVPLGKVDFMKPSTSTPSSDDKEFQSREQTFTKALNALEPNHPSHMIALCGMGGVGKTTMMRRLKKVVIERKMFHYIVEVVIGYTTDPIAIQDAVADYLGIELRGKTKPERAAELRKWFRDHSDGGKTKILIILDDVWEFVDLNDIGLSPLPNKGVDFKVLLTSRSRDVCTKMGVEASSSFNLNVLAEEEAQSLFHQFVEFSDDVDPEIRKIGEEIVRKCSGLPIAIKTMAYALRNRRKDAWEDALARLENHDTSNVVAEVLKMSYNKIQDQETKSIFLLCGLFPEDSDIPTEELVRYGWGLKLFRRVFTIREARNRLHTCIKQLIDANLLMASDDVRCVKMHDLVLAFVLEMFSEAEHASIVNHGGMLGSSANDFSGSCKRISLTCKGMYEFPKGLTFRNLSFLKLMHGDKSMRFPEDFYGEMEKLQVISYDNMKFPLLPSLECTMVRVLHLHNCLLTFDCSSIGNLLNLEVLSIANSSIALLPSTIGNLKKLRLLDLTNCVGLRIDKGVLRKLVKLEEFYMRVDDRDSFFVRVDDPKAISFIDDNYGEIAECLENISVLEFEFFQNTAQPKNMSFEKLEQFKISVGRSLKGAFKTSKHSFENTLKLVTNKDELLASRMNELFEKTEVLCLSVVDMNDIGDVVVKSVDYPRFSPFYILRVLVISECADLRYLFTLGVAKGLKNLEHLQVYSCDNMEELLNTGTGGEEIVTFPKLKFLSLICLPNLLGLRRNVNVIELPQLVELRLGAIPNVTSIYPGNKLATSCFLKGEVVIPKLEKLHIHHMENLKEIWPCESEDNVSLLREIEVTSCDNLVNLFPCNPMPLLHHLEHLKVRNCGSIEVLFNIDLDSLGESGKVIRSSSLQSIEVNQLGKLRELWRIKGANNFHSPIHGFQVTKYIEITKCKRFRNVFTPTTTKFDLGALKEIWINNKGESGRNNELVQRSQEQEINVISNEDTSEVGDYISNVAFPSYIIQSSHQLNTLKLWNFEGVEVVFEIESPRSRELVTTYDNQQLLPYLEELDIRHMHNMRHVWKCKWNTFFIHQKQVQSSFHNLTTIHMSTCRSIKYLFSPLMAKLLSNLKNVKIAICEDFEEVVSSRDDEDEEKTTSVHTSTTLFPHLDFHMRHVWKCKWNTFFIHQKQVQSSFHNLTTIHMSTCRSIKYLFSPLMAKLLSNLKNVKIAICEDFEEVVSSRDDEDEEKTTSVHTSTTLFPHLDFLTLACLKNLKYIGGGGAERSNNELSSSNATTRTTFLDQPEVDGISWSLCQYPREITIVDCDALSSVIPSCAAGQMQKLQVLKVESCKSMKEVFETHNGGCHSINFDGGNGGAPRLNNVNMLQLPHLKILEIRDCDLVEHIFTFSVLESLMQLEELMIENCREMEVIVKEEHGEQTTASKDVIFPHLKSIALVNLPDLVCFFKGMNEFRWPSLDNVRIHDCPQMTVFTYGRSIAPKLKSVQTSSGRDIHQNDLNFHIITASHQTTSSPSTSGGFPSSVHDTIKIVVDDASIKKIIPSNLLQQQQKLEEIRVWSCDLVEEVFEALEETNSGLDASQIVVKLPNLREVEVLSLHNLRYIWKSNRWTAFEFPKLTRVSISHCHTFEHVFTSSMVGSLLQLQELHVSCCNNMEVVVKDENVVEEEEKSQGKMNEITLPHLKSLILDELPCLKGFCLGKKNFSLPLLDTLRIERCGAITISTKGNSTTPELKEIYTSLGSLCAGDDINSFIKIKKVEVKGDNK